MASASRNPKLNKVLKNTKTTIRRHCFTYWSSGRGGGGDEGENGACSQSIEFDQLPEQYLDELFLGMRQDSGGGGGVTWLDSQIKWFPSSPQHLKIVWTRFRRGGGGDHWSESNELEPMLAYAYKTGGGQGAMCPHPNVIVSKSGKIGAIFGQISYEFGQNSDRIKAKIRAGPFTTPPPFFSPFLFSISHLCFHPLKKKSSHFQIDDLSYFHCCSHKDASYSWYLTFR